MRIKKKILSEKILYYAQVKMPKGFEIIRSDIVRDILLTNFYEDHKVLFNKSLQAVVTYVSDFMRLENRKDLVPHSRRGLVFDKNENSKPMLEIDTNNLKESPYFVMLYAAEVQDKTCEVIIEYNDNRRTSKEWTIPMENNRFIIFPSTERFTIKNKNNEHSNVIQLINFDYF